ncbi:MAG: sulfurtransferase [Paracoccaceae bacterium]
MSPILPETPVVSADWLAANLDAPGLVIVDTRKGDGYAAAHIQGARKLALDPHLHHPGRVEDPEVFAAEMVRLGIGPDTDIIAYDDGNNLFGARLWWVLQYHGHTRARVLDGGWNGWVAAGLPVTDASAPDPDPGAFVPRVVPALLAGTADMRTAMDDPDALILDVRGMAEWMRQEPTEISMAGHVPGARHLVWTDVIDPATHRFRPADDLRARFAALGLRPEAEVIVYCQGGIRAAHTVLTLNQAGFARVRNYEGSWAEWSRQAMPRVVEPLAAPKSDKG